MNRISEVLEDQGMSKAELARLLGKSKGIITLYTQNATQPRLSTLYQIARILRVDPRDLLKV